jgi:hypothetical protein
LKVAVKSSTPTRTHQLVDPTTIAEASATTPPTVGMMANVIQIRCASPRGFCPDDRRALMSQAYEDDLQAL